MIRIGIDEAGLGPVLGPMVVAAVAVDGDPAGLAALGAKDSKQLHKPGDLRPLAAVAVPLLRWLTGAQPRTARDLFGLVGDGGHLPWLADADLLPLPGAGYDPWQVPGCTPAGWRVRVLHAADINDPAHPSKASLELATVGAMVAGLARPPAMVQVDRLGGRRFYGEAITGWLGAPVEVMAETPRHSAYRCAGIDIAFTVGADGSDATVAAASCLAKFVREVHMLCFNRWWSAQVPGLKPTAGYPEDAARWLRDSAGRRPVADTILVRTR